MDQSFREAASRVHTALVTYAARDSDFDGHSIRAGEYLALLDGALLGSYHNLATLIKELSWAFEELSPEFITVYYGQDVAASDAEGVSATPDRLLPRRRGNPGQWRPTRVLLHDFRGVTASFLRQAVRLPSRNQGREPTTSQREIWLEHICDLENHPIRPGAGRL